MRIIVTGGAGFIGSNLIHYLLNRHSDIQVLNLDKLGYASDPAYLDPVREDERYHFAQADLAERMPVRTVLRTFRPDGIIHLAAESHVDNSIEGPDPFIYSNVVGTFNLLEEFRQYLLDDERQMAGNRVLHVSTDEVYGSLEHDGSVFTEASPYAPNSPYSASKASSDMLVRSYHRTYGMDTVITRCSNNFGPHQHDEKLIPTVIRTALQHRDIPVYGKGENVRDWLYVKDHCSALDLAFFSAGAGSTYNIGGRNEWKNIELVRRICDLLNEEHGEGPGGDYKSLIRFVTDRPGHDLRYAVDPACIERELGWRQETGFPEALRQTVCWYLERFEKRMAE